MNDADASNTGRFAISQPRNHWYIIARSADLEKKPLACKLFNTPLVLFRDAAQQVGVLLDRCAHRNVPLSVGSVNNGQLECGYHGWRFNTAGICQFVPALWGDSVGKARRVPCYPVRESQGYIWVYANPEATPTHEPFLFPYLDDPSYHAVRYSYRFQSTLYSTLENILDVPHTAFLHRGLFRSSPGKQPIQVTIRRNAQQVEAQYAGEAAPRGLLGKILAPRGGEVFHIDRFIVPSIAQVDYRLGDASHLLVTDMLTPVSDFETQLHTVVTLRLPLGAAMISHVLGPVAKFVAMQDARMLKLQTDTTRDFGGEQFVNTPVDILGPHILRLLRQAERGDTDGLEFEEKMQILL